MNPAAGHTAKPPLKVHRDTGASRCTVGAGCARRHDYIIKCSCGHREWRGKLKYTQAAMDAHLDQPQNGAEPK